MSAKRCIKSSLEIIPLDGLTTHFSPYNSSFARAQRDVFKELSLRLVQGTWPRSAVEPGPASRPLSLAPGAGPGPVRVRRRLPPEGRLQGVMLTLEGRRRPITVPRACPSPVARARGAWLVEQDWSGAGLGLSRWTSVLERWFRSRAEEAVRLSAEVWRPGVGCALRDIRASDPAHFLPLPLLCRADRPSPSSVLGVTAHRTSACLSWMCFPPSWGMLALSLSIAP